MNEEQVKREDENGKIILQPQSLPQPQPQQQQQSQPQPEPESQEQSQPKPEKKKHEKKKREKGDGINKRFENKLKNSFIARFLLFLGGLEEQMRNSLAERRIRRSKERQEKKRSALRTVKRTVAKEIEQSLIFHFVNLFFDMLLRLPMRAYGTLLFACSFGTAIVTAVKNYISGGSLFSVRSIIFYFCVAFASIFLLAVSKHKSLGDALLGSRVFSFLLCDLLGIRKRSFETDRTAEVNYPLILAAALTFSLLTILFEPSTLVFAVLWVLFVRLAFCSPESGFLTTLLFLPMLPSVELLVMVLIVAVSYFVKVFRSQRTFRASFFGLMTLMYAVLALFGTLMTPAYGGGLGIVAYLPALAAFFLAHLLLERREWVLRAASAVVFSAVFSGVWISVLYGAWYLAERKWIFTVLFPFITRYEFPAGMSGVESTGVYIAAAIALLTARYLKNKKIIFRITATLGGLILSAGAILSQHPAAWFALVTALLVLLILNKNFAVIPSTLVIAAGVIAYVLVLPKFITDYVSSANPNGFSHGFSADFVVIGQQFAASARRVFTGIGEAAVVKGENYYSHILTSQGAIGLIFLLFCLLGAFGYAYYTCIKNENCSKHIKQVLLGAVSALCALLIAGIFMDLWSDPKLPFIFFTLLGLIIAGGRVLLRESEQLSLVSDLDRDYHFIPVVREEKIDRAAEKQKKAALKAAAKLAAAHKKNAAKIAQRQKKLAARQAGKNAPPGGEYSRPDGASDDPTEERYGDGYVEGGGDPNEEGYGQLPDGDAGEQYDENDAPYDDDGPDDAGPDDDGPDDDGPDDDGPDDDGPDDDGPDGDASEDAYDEDPTDDGKETTV